ncbi:MAG: NAD(P)-dependent glycerol-3-phosphate dehydrogenase [Clostridia bacterium]|nr:NAD(P)-dependent glycerol-3-phosphate dehydrogenase [Clostridia bacterium]
MANISVLGSGGWGTALAVMADREGHNVRLWSPFEQEVSDIRRHGEHRKLLPGVPVPPSIELTTDMALAAQADAVIMAVPSFAVRSTAKALREFVADDTLVINVSKGLEDDTLCRFSEVIGEELPTCRVVVLTGPSHAEEVARAVPTSVVCASKDVGAAEQAQELLMNANFRIYVTDDVVGAELGGALKNIIALAAGICDGLEMGDNTKAALMTRGLAEAARLGTMLGARTETFAGLSGMGDLIVTCGSMHSRNRRAGMRIGRGYTPEKAVEDVGTVEGYFAAAAAYALAQKVGVEMPITEQCYRICYEHASPREALRALMGRPMRRETEALWLK